NACVVMDNAKFYQGEMVRELLEKKRSKVDLFTSLFYRVFSIENFGYQLKAILKKLKPRTYKDLIDGVT
ncbi:MAG: IS630 family transposase, partial [Cyanobacteria bacterium SW_6_48_11]